ncbi:MAG: FAD-dependent thymidylate synthase [Clostridia bacterium]|nr:FAD-dependent thymidylate synthase [Clostridia bacterium]
MKVELINYTPEPEKTVAAAARLCYSPVGATQLMEDFTEGKVEHFLDMLMKLGHMSPTEHVTFTFAIEGVSRALSHQLVRHRIASYSQKSQRYVSEDQFAYVIPPTIEANPQAKAMLVKKMEEIQRVYEELSLLVPKEDARYILPNACETKLVATFNCRSLYNFFQHRCCQRAQWEIRELAHKMLAEVKKVAPRLFTRAGAMCVTDRVCPEGSMSCGLLEKLLDADNRKKQVEGY